MFIIDWLNGITIEDNGQELSDSQVRVDNALDDIYVVIQDDKLINTYTKEGLEDYIDKETGSYTVIQFYKDEKYKIAKWQNGGSETVLTLYCFGYSCAELIKLHNERAAKIQKKKFSYGAFYYDEASEYNVTDVFSSFKKMNDYLLKLDDDPLEVYMYNGDNLIAEIRDLEEIEDICSFTTTVNTEDVAAMLNLYESYLE